MTLRYTHIQSQAQRQAAKAVEDATRSAFSSLLLIADDHGSKIVQ